MSTVEALGYLPESVARVSFAVHSDDMSSSGADRYYWCLSHNRVETEDTVCRAAKTLGPYSSPAEAEGALARIAERNAVLDAEDEQWHGQNP